MMGQFANETNRIGEEQGSIVQNPFAYRGIQGGEQFVFGEDLAAGQPIHQSGFAHVGIADQSNTELVLAVLALGLVLAINFFELP